MLSKKAKYAIKALLALADHEREEPMRIADLARAEQIPPKFLELILLGLKNQGILQSRKGKGGGYLLARDPADIYLGQIVRMFDGPLAPVPCASQTAYVPCADCRRRGGMRRPPGNEGSARRDRQGPRRDQPGLASTQGPARYPSRPDSLTGPTRTTPGPVGTRFAYLLDQLDRVYRVMDISPPANGRLDTRQDSPLSLPPALQRELGQALRSIRYGTIEIVIHDGRVVQLERREKVRFDTEVRERGK